MFFALTAIKKLKLKHLKNKEIIYYKKQISKMSNGKPVKLKDIDINKIILTPPVPNTVVGNQLMSFPTYLDGNKVDIQTEYIKMTHGGFPQPNNSFYDGVLQRANAFSLPMEKDSELHVLAIKLQQKIEGMADELVPEHMKGHIVFQDIPREYENKKKEETEYSVRVRLGLKIKDIKSEDYEVETALWEVKNKTDKSGTLIKVDTVEDVEKIIRYGKEVKFIIRLNKLYISTKNEGTKKEPKYKMGVTFKMMAAQVVAAATMNNVNYKNEYTFNNDDDDDDDDEVKNSNAPVIDTDNLDEIDEDQEED